MGLKLFMHAVRLLFDNLATAIRISGIIYVVAVLVPNFLLARGEEPPQPEELPLLFLAAMVSIAGGIWIAIAWHRYILLGEEPGGYLPEFNGRRLLSYFGWSVVLGLILVPVTLAAALLAALLGPAALMLAALVSTFIVTVVLYRIALVLPARAVDQPLRLGEAWRATSGATGDILVLALLTTLMIVLIDVPALAFVGPLEVLALGWRAVTGWIVLLVGAGILTTLYGHYAEGRPIR